MKKLIDSLTGDMRELARVGAISKPTLRQFETATVPEVDSYSQRPGSDAFPYVVDTFQSAMP